MLDGTLERFGKNEGVRKNENSGAKAIIGSPDLA